MAMNCLYWLKPEKYEKGNNHDIEIDMKYVMKSKAKLVLTS